MITLKTPPQAHALQSRVSEHTARQQTLGV